MTGLKDPKAFSGIRTFAITFEIDGKVLGAFSCNFYFKISG